MFLILSFYTDLIVNARVLLIHGVQSDPEGALWRDPPDYWEQIVWPAYMEAHREVFVDGDVEHGKSSEKVEGLVVVDALDVTMGEMIDCACEKLKKGVVQSIVLER